MNEEQKPKRKRGPNKAKALEETIDAVTRDLSLPELTSSQYNFVLNLLSGMHATDAYKKAYPNCTMRGVPLAVEAARSRNNPKIKMWIAAATKMSLMSGAVTFDRWLSDQHSLIQQCIEEKAFASAQAGHTAIGKALGFIDKKEEINPLLDPENLLKALSRVLPPILGTALWNQVENKLASVLLGTSVKQVKLIEGTNLAVEVEPKDD